MLELSAVSEDQHARERILSALNTTLLVEAGAGSGKTTSLVGRMLALIEQGAAEVGQIAAITFTRKAADELMIRFRSALERRMRESNGMQAERLHRAYREVDRCFIGTIHAFCGRLLRERPIEARLDPDFRELEEEEDKALRDRCWDEYLAELLEQGREAELEALGALHAHVEDLRSVYHRVCDYMDVDIDTALCPRPDFDLIRLSLPDMIEEAIRYVPQSKPDAGWDKLQRMLRDASGMIRLHGLADDLRVLLLALLFEGKIDATLKRWTDGKKAKEFKIMFLEWQARVLLPFLRAWREHVYPQLVAFVKPAVQYAGRRRLALGQLNFQDLLMRATALLREQESVRRYFSGRYTRLFVDEFQDTDPIQAELMFLLTADDPGVSDWRQAVPRPGSLFVVGDPKQSIYRFRRADISTYMAVKARIAGCGEVLRLSANFRSVDGIGGVVNAAFGERFPLEATAHQAAFVTMETRASNPADDRALHGMYTLTHPEIEGGKAYIAEADAEAVAQYVAWACSGGLWIQEKTEATGGYVLRDAVPGDFLVLTKTREFLHLYAERLERYGVPSVVTGGSAAYEEIGALAVLAQCLNDGDDRIALLAALKSMLFAVSDEALFHYKRQGHPIVYTWLPEPGEVSEAARPAFAALERIAAWARLVRELPALAALHRIVDELGLLALTASRPGGGGRAGTLVMLLHVLQQDTAAAASWPSLSARLLQLAGDAKLERGEMFAGRQDAVRIMNLHKAKGLEAPVVLLACPCGDYDHDADGHVDRSSEPARGYFTISRRRGQQRELLAHPPGWEELAQRERQYMLAERERLLYVAATRAKQLMIVSRYPARAQIDPWRELSSLEGLSELAIPPVDPVIRERYDARHDHAADAAAMIARIARMARLAVPTYRSASVTELAKSGAAQPPRPAAGAGRGMAFGSVVHGSIELLGRGIAVDGLEPHVRLLAEEEGMSESLLPDALAMLAAFAESPLWQRALRAKRRIHELPLRTVKLAAESSAAGTESLFLKGVIDFLFEEEGGWVLVDFKTDVLELEHLQAFVEFYRPQVETYAIELRESFGMTVNEVGLYFIQAGIYTNIPTEQEL